MGDLYISWEQDPENPEQWNDKRKGRRNSMEIKVIEGAFSVCRLKELGQAVIEDDLYFLGRTDEEISLVCRTESVPQDTAAREDGWRPFGFRENWIFL